MPRSVVRWVCALMLLMPAVDAKTKIRVLVWSERTEPTDVYPNGINGALADMLNREKDITAQAVSLSDPAQGLSGIRDADVLLWFGHKKHGEVTKENITLVMGQVHDRGLGFLPLHSAHYAKPFQGIMTEIAKSKDSKFDGIPGSWTGKVIDRGQPETIHILTPTHPIAKGLHDFLIPHTESYPEPFNVPLADAKVLEGQYERGQQNGSDGLLWHYGKGKVFYFRPGHETYPIYFQPEVQHILRNAVRYLAIT